MMLVGATNCWIITMDLDMAGAGTFVESHKARKCVNNYCSTLNCLPVCCIHKTRRIETSAECRGPLMRNWLPRPCTATLDGQAIDSALPGQSINIR